MFCLPVLNIENLCFDSMKNQINKIKPMYSEMNTSEKTDVKLTSFNRLQGSLCDYKATTLKLSLQKKMFLMTLDRNLFDLNEKSCSHNGI